MRLKQLSLAIFALFGGLASTAHAVDTSFSGFAQITAGRVLSGDPTNGQSGATPYTHLVIHKSRSPWQPA